MPPSEILTKIVPSLAISAFQLDLTSLVHKGWILKDAVIEATEVNFGLNVEATSDKSKP